MTPTLTGNGERWEFVIFTICMTCGWSECEASSLPVDDQVWEGEDLDDIFD